MIRLISLDSGTRPWLLVLVLTAHKRGGRSCPQPGRSFYHKTPNSDWLSGTWPWSCLGRGRPQSGRSELPATGALLLTIQCLGNNCLPDTWTWPCLGLDRPQSGRSELSATGALLIPFKCLTVIHSQIHDHDLVLVLTAHNRGGRSCQQPGRSLYH